MSDETKMREQVLLIHDLFWEALSERDIELRFSVCDDNITFIGTGYGERAIGKEAYKKINQKGVEQFPDHFKLDFKWKELSLFENTAWVESYVVWMQEINGIEYKEPVRNTTILKHKNEKWWIAHVHGSSPDFRLQAGDYMTNEKTIARNKELEKQVYDRTEELHNTLNELKATQAQLIQSEKMASLGELTAGIAHEIQNPLNFVKNFSEVNIELIQELKEEIENGDYEEVAVIANDIANNEQKIIHHGKRADAIVKNMLQHSRDNGEEKSLTDINALADEYLRLSYHGLRAKDKFFNSDFKAELDENLPKINIVPQAIGRVLLNLINNAFYAVSEASAKETADESYKPIVMVSTKKLNNKVEIRVKDNGSGIPNEIKEKIFQPFFTTKPTGEGTGLGLSMSYDIITNWHGGTMKVETKKGKGSDFIIQLPA